MNYERKYDLSGSTLFKIIYEDSFKKSFVKYVLSDSYEEVVRLANELGEKYNINIVEDDISCITIVRVNE